MKKKKIIVAKNTKFYKIVNEKFENIKERITSFLEMPKEMMDGHIKMSIVDNGYIVLEGSSKIEEYTDTYIKLKTSKHIVILEGRTLNIRDMNKDELIIEGNINNIIYINKV